MSPSTPDVEMVVSVVAATARVFLSLNKFIQLKAGSFVISKDGTKNVATSFLWIQMYLVLKIQQLFLCP
jgi:hypothetical protein